MKKISKKQKLIILISIITIIVIIGLAIGINAIRVNIANGKYNSSNGSSNNGNLVPEYIKEGITLGGVTGTLEDLDTSDATATPEDILYGKTAYVDGKKITGTYRTLGMLQVGDYVAYVPNTENNFYELSSKYSGAESNQTIYKEDFSWQILSINDNGTVDLITSNSTNAAIGFANAIGYNNGVYLMNDIAEKLYSNTKLNAIGRNLNIEDIEKHMTEEGLNYVQSLSKDGIMFGKTTSHTKNTYYPKLYEKENGSGINTTDIKKDGIDSSASYYLEPTTETQGKADSGGLTTTMTYYEIAMDSKYYDSTTFYNLIHNINNSYWLSSRYVIAGSSYSRYGFRVIINKTFDGNSMYDSGGATYGTRKQCLRPVVTLKSNTKIGEGDGKGIDSAYEIIE